MGGGSGTARSAAGLGQSTRTRGGSGSGAAHPPAQHPLNQRATEPPAPRVSHARTGNDGEGSDASGYYHAPIREIRNRKGDYGDQICGVPLCVPCHRACAHTHTRTHASAHTCMHRHPYMHTLLATNHLNTGAAALCPASGRCVCPDPCLKAGRYVPESRQEQTDTHD